MKKKSIVLLLAFVAMIAVIIMLLIAINIKRAKQEELSNNEANEKIAVEEDIGTDEIGIEEAGTEETGTDELGTDEITSNTTDVEIMEEDLQGDTDDLEYNVLDFQATLYAQKNANVRSGPGTSFSKIGSIIKNQELKITGQADNGWYRIDYLGTVGFVSNTLIGANPVVDQEPIVEQEPIVPKNSPLPEEIQPDSTLSTTTTIPSTSTNTAYAQTVIDLVNSNREAIGLGSLTSTPELMSAAAKRAEEIVTLFEHKRPDGRLWSTIAEEYNVSYNYLGENIAAGQLTPEEVMEGWMNSPGHQANILKPEFGHIGVGSYLASDGKYYWAQLFTN